MNQPIMETPQIQVPLQQKSLLMGQRIPKDFFVTTGAGESDITIHAGSYHLALKQAGIEMCNIISYSSILPAIATEIKKPDSLVHGSVMEVINAVAHTEQGKRATAAIIHGWLYHKKTGEKYGGLVCEETGDHSTEEIEVQLHQSLNELYINGFSQDYDLREIKLITKTITPKKRFGTAIVALCFVNYVLPIIKEMN
ncbi:MAG: pyruvoyl-dependent arginine decarboxylase [Nanoarchaeota archaeon]|nr:pyruvoyl-dependent arginine decarboxylase [Nanoarchaeota archaeon]